jgi:DNA-binding Lrp family transcriptional regulator
MSGPGRPRGHVIDDVDAKLMSELRDNPDLTIEQAAKRVGLSYSACRRRIEFLYNHNIIVKTVMAVPNNVIDVITNLVFIKLPVANQEKLDALSEHVGLIDEIVFADVIGGHDDVVLRIETAGGERCEEIRRGIVREFSGAKTRTVNVLGNLKRSKFAPGRFVTKGKRLR